MTPAEIDAAVRRLMKAFSQQVADDLYRFEMNDRGEVTANDSSHPRRGHLHSARAGEKRRPFSGARLREDCWLI